jgi:hypothetical protein
VAALLASIQRIDATDRNAARVAREIAHIAGRLLRLETSRRGLPGVLSRILAANPSWSRKSWGLHELTAADLDGNLFRVFYDFATPEHPKDA